ARPNSILTMKKSDDVSIHAPARGATAFLQRQVKTTLNSNIALVRLLKNSVIIALKKVCNKPIIISRLKER
ncbi:MAG: hypothetical protein ACJAV1_003798, partial [Paraglaciecola sp.]